MLQLLQGESIVQFLVQPDGRLGGDVKLMKSAGYREFDEEAVAIVRRAAPFPAMKRPLRITLRVPFDNPVLR